MTEVANIIADLVRAGVDPELVGRTAAALSAREPVLVPDEAAERRRAADRERKRLRKSAESAESAETPAPPKVSPKPPSKNPPLPPPSSNDDRACSRFFDEFWLAYPRREGDNPKKPAKFSFLRALKRGADPQHIIAGAKALRAKHPLPSPFVPQAVTWLNQERWNDTEPIQSEPVAMRGLVKVTNADPQWPTVKAKFFAEKGRPLNLTEYYAPEEWLAA